jgi:NAD(P)-dependent dehydrogenase (short-subunit alcohol dehydrogenase family)
MPSFTPASIPDLHGRTAIITGANSGVGSEAARFLANAGAHVVFAVRNVEKGQRAAAGVSGSTEVRELDLASLASVRSFAAAFDGEIHLLINNAGIVPKRLERTADGFEMQFGTNHLGHFALTNLLLPQITGRVVTVASLGERGGHIDFDDPNYERRPYKQLQAYGQSKLANVLFTSELQRRLDRVGSKVHTEVVHPGFVATNIWREGNARLDFLVRVAAQSPAQGALTIVYAAVADIPGDSFVGPKHFFHMRGAPELISRSDAAKDADSARRLWTLSEQLTGVTFPLADAQTASS